ncbi:MAG: DNA repair protein RadC, partial [Parabacteroides sp.]
MTLTSIAHLSVNERPRERLQRLGTDALSNRELLAIILRNGTQKFPVLELANQILTHFSGSLNQLAAADPKELQKIPGIGIAKSMELHAAFALASRMTQEQANRRTKANSPDAVAEYIREKVRFAQQEEFHVITLNARHEIIRSEKITQGLIDRSLVHAREVFRTAIRENSMSIIIAHNHPSGNPLPSNADILITEQLFYAGKIIDIQLLDH